MLGTLLPWIKSWHNNLLELVASSCHSWPKCTIFGESLARNGSFDKVMDLEVISCWTRLNRAACYESLGKFFFSLVKVKMPGTAHQPCNLFQIYVKNQLCSFCSPQVWTDPQKICSKIYNSEKSFLWGNLLSYKCVRKADVKKVVVFEESFWNA